MVKISVLSDISNKGEKAAGRSLADALEHCIEALCNFPKTIRLIIGLTQREMADRLGMTEHAVQCIEVGRRKPSFKTLNKLVKLARTHKDSNVQTNDY